MARGPEERYGDHEAPHHSRHGLQDLHHRSRREPPHQGAARGLFNDECVCGVFVCCVHGVGVGVVRKFSQVGQLVNSQCTFELWPGTQGFQVGDGRERCVLTGLGSEDLRGQVP